MELTGLPAVSAPLPWQAQLWEQLAQQAVAGQLPHALLLAGPRYIGKERLALALARLLLCAQPSEGLNCGRCPSCEFSAAGTHGDLRWLQPEGSSRVIKIEQIRQALEFAGKTPGYSRRKVLVISPADNLNVHAANALLKCLEEPAPGTHFLLVCDRLQRVPATVRSRCRIQKLVVPDGEQAGSWLGQLTGDVAAAGQLLELAEQRPLLAERLLLDGEVETYAARRAALKGLLDGQVRPLDATPLLADMTPTDFLTQLTGELHRLLAAMDAAQLNSPRGRTAFGLLDEIGAISRALEGGSNPNAQLLLESLLARTQQMLGERSRGANMD